MSPLNPTGDRIGQVYYFMGETYIRLGQYNNADIALSTALYHIPSAARWWSRLGYAREGAGKVENRRRMLIMRPCVSSRPFRKPAKGLERIARNYLRIDLKAAFFTLGCKLNQCETEALAEAFEQAGFNDCRIFRRGGCLSSSIPAQSPQRVNRKPVG